MPKVSLFLSLLFCLLLHTAWSQSTPSGKPWQELTGCELVKSAYADGDSFHVKHQGKEYIFRLYFVDCPEPYVKGGFHKRTTAQAKYFNIYKKDLYKMAAAASEFTAAALEDDFTVWTCWLDAKGQSRLPRYFGIVTTSQGDDLAELLVKNGLARVYGAPADPPFKSERRLRKALRKAEEEAQDDKVGAWAYAKK